MRIQLLHDTLYDINRRIAGESPSVTQVPGKDRANKKASEKQFGAVKKVAMR